MAQFGTFTIAGKDYDLDDFELGDLETVENLCQRRARKNDGVYMQDAEGHFMYEPTPFGELDFNDTKVLRAFLFVILRRANPEMTFEDTSGMKLITFAEGEEDIPDTGPPDGEATTSDQNGSDLAASGVPASDTLALG